MSPLRAWLQLAGALLVGLVVGVLVCALWQRTHPPAPGAIAVAVAQADTAKQREDSAATVLQHQRDSLLAWLQPDTVYRTRVDTFMLAPVTHQDTVQAAGQLPIAVAERDTARAILDTVRRKCSEYVVSCDRFRVLAAERDTAQQHVITVQGAQLAYEQRRHAWYQPHATLGAGAVYAKGQLHAGPALVLGWNVW